MVKFNKSLQEIPAIISFDLALYKTGCSVFIPQEKKIAKAWEIEVSKSSAEPLLNLYQEIMYALESTIKEYGSAMVIREALPNQCGFKSSIGALQGLAKAHAVLDVCIGLNRLSVENYDENGVHAISVKSFFKTSEIPHPEKKDIRAAVVQYYGLDDSKLTDNISDSIAVVHTLIHRKWNQDIDEEIKRLKKEIKQLKASKAIEVRQEQINKLITLKL